MKYHCRPGDRHRTAPQGELGQLGDAAWRLRGGNAGSALHDARQLRTPELSESVRHHSHLSRERMPMRAPSGTVSRRNAKAGTDSAGGRG